MSEKLLQQNIEEAILALAPKFDIPPELLTTFRQPTYEVCEVITVDGKETKIVGQYDREDVHFRFPSQSIDDFRIVGHEVGHYLHHELNPNLMSQCAKKGQNNRNFWWGIELAELVAKYAGIIYSVSKGVPYRKYLDHSNGGQGFDALRSAIIHERADKRSEKAWYLKDETLLSSLARMDLDGGVCALPRIFPVTFYERSILPKMDRLRIIGSNFYMG
ncbi:MAG: hypothetical protein WCV90_02400 [Candidatus Woesearchaeota archaeon]|jgi:hypothetical protein